MLLYGNPILANASTAFPVCYHVWPLELLLSMTNTNRTAPVTAKLARFVCALSLALVPVAALAQSLPGKPIRMVVGLAQGIEPAGSTPQEFEAFWKSELTKWARVVKSANIRPE